MLAEKHPSVNLYLVALAYEIFSVKGSEQRVRHLFETALSTDGFKGVVILWRVYMAWELQQGQNHSENAEAARRDFFRAIHICPWSKQLWLDGLRSLGSVLSPREMGELLDIMREKELRIRTDVYEILLQEAEEEELSENAVD